MRKKIYFLLITIVLFCFASCANLLSPKTSSIDFTLGKNVADEISKAAANISEDSQFDITCSFDGIELKAVSVSVNKNKLFNANFSIENIPYNREFKILLDVSFNGHTIYEGVSNLIKLTEKTDGLGVNVQIKPRRSLISYDKNGEDINLDTNEKSFVESYFIDETVTVDDLPKIEKPGYKSNWYFDKECTKPVTEFGQNDYLGDVTLYAKRTLIEYSITYKNCESDVTNSNPQTYTVEDAVNFVDPEKSGHIFGGWYTDNKMSIPASNISKGQTVDVTLYAKWTPITYKIEYNLDGGVTSSQDGALSVEVTYSDTATTTLKTYSNSYTKDGYISVDKWKDENGLLYNEGSEIPNNLTTIQGKIVKLTAQWRKLIGDVTNLTGEQEDKKVTLKWNNPEGTDKVLVSYKKGSESTETEAGQVSGNATSLSVTGLERNTKYTFIVRTVDKFGIQSSGVEYISYANPLQTFSDDVIVLSPSEYTSPNEVNTEKKKDWTYVAFGYWPQARKSNDVSIIDESTPTKTYNNWPLYLGNDNWYYIKLDRATPADPSSTYLDGTAIDTSKPEYFKLESIKWRIIDSSSGQYLVNEHVLVGGKYTNAASFTQGSDFYFDSYVRDYLRTTFQSKAFSATSQTKLLNKNLYGGQEDFVFLVGARDIQTPERGFYGNWRVTDRAKIRRITDYAIATGVPKIGDGLACTRLSTFNKDAPDICMETGKINPNGDVNLIAGYMIGVVVSGTK